MRSLPSLLLLCAAILLGGCGDGLPERVIVTGKVTYQGKPLPTGTISFSPKTERATRPSLAYLLEDGTYKMTTFRADDGTQPGEYSVAVIAYDEGPLSNAEQWRRQGKKLIPEKYFKHATSGLEATVPEHDVELNFDLK